MLVKDIEKALNLSVQNNWNYGGMALSNRALVHLCRHLESREEPYHILELGGGKSTLFWYDLNALDLLSIKVTTLEHHEDCATQLAQRVETQTNIQIHPQTLKQITDQEREEIFLNARKSLENWGLYGKLITKNQYDFYTIHNAFYAEVDQLPLDSESIDVMIVDGPHGNGRSLAYPLFCNVLKPNALVLIDDFDHYLFLNDIGQIFQYEELYREILGHERWCLIQLQGLK